MVLKIQNKFTPLAIMEGFGKNIQSFVAIKKEIKKNKINKCKK